MSDATDISSLYRRFGGDPEQYQEVGQANQAQASRERWPLLSAIHPERAMLPPSVGERADPPNAGSPWPPSTPVVASAVMPIPLAAAVRVEPWLAPPVTAQGGTAARPAAVDAVAAAPVDAAVAAPGAEPAFAPVPAATVASAAQAATPVAVASVPAMAAVVPAPPPAPAESAQQQAVAPAPRVAPVAAQAPGQTHPAPAAPAVPQPAESAPARGSLKNVFARLASGSFSSSKQP